MSEQCDVFFPEHNNVTESGKVPNWYLGDNTFDADLAGVGVVR